MSMLERVALNQTRLRVPGLSLDARGVAIGTRGLVLFPAVDGLVTFLAAWCDGASLASIADGLRIDVLRSALGLREIALGFDAGGAERLDRAAELARVAGGLCFTGTQRHFVEWRDLRAPLGWDVSELSSDDSEVVLHHTRFEQGYAIERSIALEALLLELEPRVAPVTRSASFPWWIMAELGLGLALIGFLSRAGATARTSLVQWAPETALDREATQRWLFRLDEAPARVRTTLTSTPGITVFVPDGTTAAVEIGFRHPVPLAASSCFREGLVLFRGRRAPPWRLAALPELVELTRFAKLGRVEGAVSVAGEAARRGAAMSALGIEARLVASNAFPRDVSASVVGPDEIAALRRIAYLASAPALEATRVAFVDGHAYLVREGGIEELPVGRFHRRAAERVYVPLGTELVPRVAPALAARRWGDLEGKRCFVGEAGVVVLDDADFVPLGEALVAAEPWTAASALPIERLAATKLPELRHDSTGFFDLRAAGPAEGGDG